MPRSYTDEFKNEIVRLCLEEGRTKSSLQAEYGVSKSTITLWCNKFTEECQEQANNNPDYQNQAELMKEIQRLKRQLADEQKENAFLKKAAAFFAKEID